MTRRDFLQTETAAIASAAVPEKKVAAIITIYTDDRLKSHAAVIIGRLSFEYSPNGVRVEPRTRIVSMYTDQFPDNDLSRGIAAERGFKFIVRSPRP